jgi:hypothetical protein
MKRSLSYAQGDVKNTFIPARKEPIFFMCPIFHGDGKVGGVGDERVGMLRTICFLK